MTDTAVEPPAAPAGSPEPASEGWLATYRYPLTVFALSRVAVYLLIAAASWTSRIPRESGVSWHGLFGALGQWDVVWYRWIADHGYDPAIGHGNSAAFFPLYPLLTRALVLPHPSEAALLFSAYVVSLACFAGALWLFERLVELELGQRVAGTAVWLIALFPAAVFFSAPYSESLFLLVSVGAFYTARTGRWAWAGVLAAAAAATRSAGIVLLLPLFLFWLDSRPRNGRDVAWLALAPLGLAAYALHLEVAHGDAFAFLDAQKIWFREFAGPFVGVWDGTTAAWDGVRQLVSGSRETVYFELAAGDPFRVAAINLLLFAFLVFAIVAVVGAFRRLPRAYGAYALAALALPLSYPVDPQPLMSLPRFLAVLFPLFMWLAVVTEERGWTVPVTAASAVGLGLFTTQFAAWEWIA